MPLVVVCLRFLLVRSKYGTPLENAAVNDVRLRHKAPCRHLCHPYKARHVSEMCVYTTPMSILQYASASDLVPYELGMQFIWE